jgi:hypothetical protein
MRAAPSFVQRELGDDEACAFLVQAANELATAANKIEQAVSKAMANELGSELGNSRNARKVIDKEMETVTKRVNAASERAQ